VKVNTIPSHRNSLSEAYAHAEDLYSNAVSLSQLLDAWSKRSVAPALTADASDYLIHNLINARASLDALERTLAEHMPILDHTQELSHA